MKIQVELNILSDDELKNQWGSYLKENDGDIELNQNAYRIGEFIFTFSDSLASIDLEKIMNKVTNLLKKNMLRTPFSVLVF